MAATSRKTDVIAFTGPRYTKWAYDICISGGGRFVNNRWLLKLELEDTLLFPEFRDVDQLEVWETAPNLITCRPMP